MGMSSKGAGWTRLWEDLAATPASEECEAALLGLGPLPRARWAGLGGQPGARRPCAVAGRGDLGPGATRGSSAPTAPRPLRGCGDHGEFPGVTVTRPRGVRAWESCGLCSPVPSSRRDLKCLKCSGSGVSNPRPFPSRLAAPGTGNKSIHFHISACVLKRHLLVSDSWHQLFLLQRAFLTDR